MMVDIAHIAGLVAAGLHPSPVPFADFVTSTTHKTLRGPRGGVVMCKEQYAADLDRTVMPGIQGGPLMHIIAAKAVAFKEAMTDEFKQYQQKVIDNAKAMAQSLAEKNHRIVSGGTDTHLFLVSFIDVPKITGKKVEKALGKAGITVNKNGIPYDPHPPAVSGGIRIGTPALTTRGFGTEEMKQVGTLICDVFDNLFNDDVIKKVKSGVLELSGKFPMDQFLID